MSTADKLAALRETYENRPVWGSDWSRGSKGRVAEATYHSALVHAAPALEALVRAAEAAQGALNRVRSDGWYMDSDDGPGVMVYGASNSLDAALAELGKVIEAE